MQHPVRDSITCPAFYGLVVAVSSLASPFATVITKNIDANFDIDTADLQRDDTEVRQQVTYAYLCSYACKIFSTVLSTSYYQIAGGDGCS
ncbi:hypothetical protein PR003_g28919 [Phytophthora rubi]|uniref:Uncharacterized protein n=2 Tax=Phytophthora rubi TaxID=129364 RepID=A0A6A3HHJ3_9STRA|nr:hypothetical protein PR002_g27561 [Phytophthora rubi]KAE9276956.1 hypothetical protein PR003_g28919 [Phytophthora rubi]